MNILGTTMVAIVSLGWGVAAWAGDREDHIELEETLISGNQELPKVLYIVPWQDPSQRPAGRMEPNVIEPPVFRALYPPDYRRELNQYHLLDASVAQE